MTRPAPSERVPQPEVVRHWLRSECEAAAAGRGAGPVVDVDGDEDLHFGGDAPRGDDALPAPGRVDSLSERAALDRLLRAKPGAAGFLARDEPVRWHRTTVDGGELRRLRLVECPEGLLWRALAPDRSPVTAARAVAGGDPDALTAGTGVDVRRVLAIRESLVASGEPARALVVRTRRGRAPWTVVDGNHRAVARAMELVDDVELETAGTGGHDGPDRDAGFALQPVYVGVRPNPVARPLAERAGGVVRRLLGRGPTPG